jgi:hypothetical protein
MKVPIRAAAADGANVMRGKTSRKVAAMAASCAGLKSSRLRQSAPTPYTSDYKKQTIVQGGWQ